MPEKQCPVCGNRLYSFAHDCGAISRVDGRRICGNCGLAEAMQAMATVSHLPPTLWERLIADGEV